MTVFEPAGSGSSGVRRKVPYQSLDLVEKLLLEDGFETFSRPRTVAWAITHEQAERIVAGLADHVASAVAGVACPLKPIGVRTR